MSPSKQPKPPSAKARQVDIFIYPGVSFSAALMMQDFLNLANQLFADATSPMYQAQYRPFDIRLVGMETRLKNIPFRAADHAVSLQLQAPRAAPALIFIPPLWYDTGKQLATIVQQQATLGDWLCQQHAAGSIIASSCTGTTLLAQAGLLNQTQATGCWWLANWYARHTPNAQFCLEKLVHVENRIWTAAAGTAFFNLFLELMTHFAGAEAATILSRMLLVAPNDAPQAAFMSRPAVSNIEDIVVAKAQRWLAKHLAQPFNLDALAAACAVSSRTLMRRFKQVLGMTPLSYLQHERIAKALLASTGLSHVLIMERVGYSDLSSFRKLFRTHTGLTPTDYRERFRSRRRLSQV
ncbi:GlxA family transcriptional regulator [Parvibium lacunae]|uniref:Helix-turn-helix domain-containing protein n=1 Tax=Parvibium lacunae TaxID=1888893 RepID=A0A368L4C1_9BURK|nr:helix-turn-helix domain-containing protein [Parvibium lacunae]RCS58428.1 helix-turn-helix domain-containing protein [Parvibium lacunae]